MADHYINPKLREAYKKYGDEWQKDAACKDQPIQVFFPYNPIGAPKSFREVQEAPGIAICDRCPVQNTCLAFAIEAEEKFGIWGGMGEKERTTLINRRKRLNKEKEAWQSYSISG